MPDYLIGLDLGQATDPTALAMLKRSLAIGADGLPVRTARGDRCYRFDCVHLERFTLGTSYPAIVERVAEVVARPEVGARPRLMIDATGVGRPVVDMFIDRRLGIDIHPVTITAGESARVGGWGVACVRAHWVPKAELVSAVQAGLQSGRLKIVPRLGLADTLKRELLRFQVKITAAAHEQFGAWRTGSHDDLVLAVALAVWIGGQRGYEFDPHDIRGRDGMVLAGELRREQEEERAALLREEDAEQARLEAEYGRIDSPHWWG